MNEIIEDISNRLDAVNAKYLAGIEKMMEEMANAPREELGKRQPGEKCSSEIPRKLST